MVINKNTANRIKNYCKAIEEYSIIEELPISAYTFSELPGKTAKEKLEAYSELVFATGNKQPSRSFLRKYKKVMSEYGDTHNERMLSIAFVKSQIREKAL